jgi:phosphatidylcholine synthase
VTGATAPDLKRQVILAWGVHLFTASGAVIAAVTLQQVMAGHLEAACLLMLAALLIDSLDGTLARRVGVADVVPEIDGRRLDDIVDFLNYAVTPVVFLLAIGALPHWVWAAFPILASCYGFSQQQAKTDDDFFLGFPSYWNVVAIYVWLLGVGPVAATALVVVLSVGVFVPLKYVYLSKLRVGRGSSVLVACGWGLLVVAAIVFPERARPLRLVEVSLAFPIYYLGQSAWLGGWLRRAP